LSVRRWQDGWRSDLRDEFGIRRRRDFPTKAEATVYDDERRRQIRNSKAARRGDQVIVDPNLTLSGWLPTWLEKRKQQIDPDTFARNAADLKHIIPHLGEMKLREITRSRVELFVLALLRATKKDGKPYARESVRLTLSTLSALMTDAKAAHLILEHPTRGLWKEFNKGKKKRTKKRIKALDPEATRLFLASALEHAPAHFPYFAILVWAGLRPSEGLAVRAEKINAASRSYLCDVQLKIRGGELPTKSGGERHVDLSRRLLGVLTGVVRARKAAALAGAEQGPYLFWPKMTTVTPKAVRNTLSRCRRVMTRVLEKAGLPTYYTPHSLRHTYAVSLISAGVSPVYVQQQLGHASIQETVGTYGSWFPVRAAGAVDALADSTAPGSVGAGVAGDGHEMDTIAGRMVESDS
jgi:integrase